MGSRGVVSRPSRVQPFLLWSILHSAFRWREPGVDEHHGVEAFLAEPVFEGIDKLVRSARGIGSRGVHF